MGDSKKSILEIFVLPVVLAVGGTISTISINRAQLNSAKEIADANRYSENNRSESEQQLKLLEMFSDQFKDKDPAKRKAAVQILTTLKPELGTKLANAIADSDPDSGVQKAARTVVEKVSSVKNSFLPIGSYASKEEAQKHLTKIQVDNKNLPLPLKIFYAEDRKYQYVLTLGGPMTYAEANRQLEYARTLAPDAYVRQSEKWQAVSP